MATPPGPHDPRTAQPNALPSIEVGTRLTDYASLDLVVEGGAEGGYGLVVWGPDRANGDRMKALKLPRPDLLARANAQSAAEGERLRREFEREALIWCHLWGHADIIAASGLTRLPGWDNLPALQLEFAPRGSLRQKVTEAHRSHGGIIPLRTALAWGQQIAAALAVIHQPDPAHERPEPLVHCDLKPENVLLNTQGWALLTDLGLTRAYAATTTAEALEAISTLSLPVSVVATQGDGQAASERDERLARMRAALQAAGLLTASANDSATAATIPAKGGVALGTGQGQQTRSEGSDATFQTRSVRIPPLSAARLATLLAQRPASPTGGAAAPAVVGAPLPTEPGIGSRGPVAGTPPYMAPEQWWGLDAVTPASDVYALGVLLFELFTGGAWSSQQRWLAEDLGETGAQSADERYVRFPHAPQFTVEARAYAEDGWGGVAGQDAYFAAWYAAHRAGPRWRLADPAVGALTRGPLAELTDQTQAANQALTALSDLIAECLAPEAGQRPTAEAVQQRLGKIARLVALEPLLIPEVTEHTPVHEAEFWENLAISYSYIGQFDERLRLQQRVVSLDPGNPQRWMNLGAAFGYLGRHEEALAAYAEAEQRLTPAYQAQNPQRAALLASAIPSNQGVALKNLGRYQEAVAAYRQALALRPDKADVRFNLSLALQRWSQETGATREQRLERLRAARLELRQVLSEAPAIANGQALRQQIERALARLEEA